MNFGRPAANTFDVGSPRSIASCCRPVLVCARITRRDGRVFRLAVAM